MEVRIEQPYWRRGICAAGLVFIVWGLVNSQTTIFAIGAGAVALWGIWELAGGYRLRKAPQAQSQEKTAIELLERRLELSEAFNRQIIECSNDCITILDAKGRITFRNHRGCVLMEEGASGIAGAIWLDGFEGAEAVTTRDAFSGALQGKTASVRAHLPTAKGTPKWWDFAFSGIANTSGTIDRVLVVARDLTEHMQVEKALRESEEAFRKIFEEGPVAKVLGTTDFKITKINNAFSRMLGYTEAELVGKGFSEITHPDYIGKDLFLTERVIAGELPSYQIEKKYLTKRQETVWGHMTLSVIRDPEGKPAYVVGMIENINERKNVEAKVLAYQEQLQRLASKLSLSEERERRRIATNLHDQIGQSLAFAKLKLGILAQSEGIAEHKPSIEEIRQLIEDAMGNTRSLTFELSPPVLYELGLVPAIEWLARKIQQEHGIETRFHDDGQSKILDDDLRIVIFQAVRELLVNVVKHAKATHVNVFSRRDSDALRIIVEDDGVGFDPGTKQAWSEGASGFGLFSIRERLEYLGGHVKIRSQPGEGTRITLLAPMRVTHEGSPDSTAE